MALALPAELAAALQAAYQKLGSSLADLDFEEQNKRRTFEDILAGLLRNKEGSLRSNAYNMADRGLTQSGINLAQNVDINTAYDRDMFSKTGAFNTDLSDIARRRLEAQANYNTLQGDLERQAAAMAAPAISSGGGRSNSGGGGMLGSPNTPSVIDQVKQLGPLANYDFSQQLYRGSAGKQTRTPDVSEQRKKNVASTVAKGGGGLIKTR